MNLASEMAQNIDRLMRRIHSEIHPRASEFDMHNLGPLGGMVLLSISELEPVDIKTVVDSLGRDKSQISRLVQRLEGKGLLHRRTNSSDRRIVDLRLTPSGHEQVQQINSALTSVVTNIFSVLSETEKNELRKILRKVTSKEGE